VETAFLKTADEIHAKILAGEIDVSNESHGIKVGMATGTQGNTGLPGMNNAGAASKRQSGCC
jgi:hypothetical protein